MKIAVRYYSKSGNTEKVARAMAEALNIQEISIAEAPPEEEADLLFLGTAPYGFGLDPEVKAFLGKLESGKVKKIVLFNTSALLKSIRSYVEKALAGKNIPLADREFHCWGEFKFTRKGHPNEADLERARAFAREIGGAQS